MFYVYEHWRPDTNRPFYVGKGQGWRAGVLRGRNPKHKNITAKAGRVVKFVATGLSEREAFDLERERIALWRSMNVTLANFTDGGEGACGNTQSAETRAKRSAALAGRERSPAECESISRGLKGRQFDTTWRSKMSTAAKNRLRVPCSEETRAKIGASNKIRAAERAARKQEPATWT